MEAYSGTGFWHWYEMPVPVRKFFKNRVIKRLEKQSGLNSDPKPMPLSEKMRLNRDMQRVTNDPAKLNSLMQLQRNRK